MNIILFIQSRDLVCSKGVRWGRYMRTLKWVTHVPTSPLDILQKAIYLFQKTSYSPCGAFLFRTKPIFALNACAEQQALVSTTYQVEDTFHTRSDTNVECLPYGTTLISHTHAF